MKLSTGKPIILLFFVVQTTAVIAQGERPASESFPRGMVSLTFDDGRLSAFTHGRYYLDRAGLKGTFYITIQNLGQKGFMTESQVLEIASRGHEIGSHTKTHPYLSRLTPIEIANEIYGSKQSLYALGVKSVNTFAYPYGDYSDATDELVRKAGYAGARVSNRGSNAKNTNAYRLKAQSVEADTSLKQIRQWIDQSIRDKTWLILLFHGIDESVTQYSIVPSNFEKIVKYLVHEKVSVVTVEQGLSEMSQ